LNVGRTLCHSLAAGSQLFQQRKSHLNDFCKQNLMITGPDGHP
jgi:hypothetical protein